MDLPGHSAAWLAHLLWEQRVAGSNPVAPIEGDSVQSRLFFFLVDPLAIGLNLRYNIYT